MHEIILEIIQRNYNEFTGTNEAETCSASEIASLMRGFEEWKDHFYFSYDGKVYMQKTEAEPKTLDELFSYWYQNVKPKNN